MSKKTDHIAEAIKEAKERTPTVKDAVVEQISIVLNDHMGADLKKSEIQATASELIKLQTVKADEKHEK